MHTFPKTGASCPVWLVMFLVLTLVFLFYAQLLLARSVYQEKPKDPEALYFTPKHFNVDASGKTDVSDELQRAINKVKTEKNFGILFIPEGKYKITKTIYVPAAIRLIGYGKNRPEIILAENSPGFSNEQNYMIWFTGGIVTGTQEPRDAGAGTFYSALSNIDMRIEDGNPKAIALRTHFAQHSFVNHCDLFIGQGYAGIYDLGNEIEDVRFYGGEYGITSSRTSPGWPMMMVDLFFNGQRKAAIVSRNTGMTIIAMHIQNVPVGVELQEDIPDRLYMENCLLENVAKGVIVGTDYNATSQLNLVNITCKNVPVAVHFTKGNKEVAVDEMLYRINNFTSGLVMNNMADNSEYRTVSDIVPLDQILSGIPKVVPDLPAMDTWVNIRDLGARGDGETDDTEAFKKAISKHKSIYLPTGWYRITQPLKLAEGTRLIGLHPFATQLMLHESEPAFSGFGSPVPLLESSTGADDIVNGIGINTGAYNYRAVGLKWLAGARSLINDVKFVGGHGTMRKPSDQSDYNEPGGRDRKISTPGEPRYAQGMDLAWDNQYWSLWVTNGGGGTLKDIWTASTYAGVGFYVSNTSTPSNVMAMSLEHHVRQECRLSNVSNWNFYAFQFEEESREGKDCQTLEMNDCHNLVFANFWMYRVIRVNTPRHWGVKVSNCSNIDFRNMRNWTQVLHVPELTIYDMDKNLAVYPWDFARLTITGKEPARHSMEDNIGVAEKLAFGYEFATGAVADSKGNVYFCENQRKKVYKWSAETNSVSVYADYPFKPFSLAVDTKDNLIVICRYDPQPGYMVNGEPERIPKLADDNPYYSGWGNGGWAALAYAISPEKPDDMQPLQRIKTAEATNVQRLIYPAHRWRGNFEEITTGMPENSFLAPDGVTLIPESYDIGRSVQLLSVAPLQSQPVYVTHEDPKITYRFDVGKDGRLTNMQKQVARGEYSTITDTDGTYYLAEGQIFVFDNNGNELKRINLDERPLSMAIGGKGHDLLFVTTSNSLYKIRIR